MRANRYHRLRAQEMALRDFLADRHSNNPFPADSMEARVYATAMAASLRFAGMMSEMCVAYGHAEPKRRSPEDVAVRPALEGWQYE